MFGSLSGLPQSAYLAHEDAYHLICRSHQLRQCIAITPPGSEAPGTPHQINPSPEINIEDEHKKSPSAPDFKSMIGNRRLLKHNQQVKAASDRPSVDALLFLPVPGDAGTVSFNKSIALDTEAPYVRSVAVTTGDGVYGTGDTIGLVCLFSQPVVVVGEDAGTPSIGLSLGRSDKTARAVYSGGNGTAEFELSYTVRAVCTIHG